MTSIQVSMLHLRIYLISLSLALLRFYLEIQIPPPPMDICLLPTRLLEQRHISLWVDGEYSAVAYSEVRLMIYDLLRKWRLLMSTIHLSHPLVTMLVGLLMWLRLRGWIARRPALARTSASHR
jgi:hypothetical protein